MAMSQRLWVPVLVALAAVTLLGLPGDGGQVTAAEPRVTVGNIMIPAAAFVPVTDGYDYNNDGSSLYVDSGQGYFTAPVSFPVPVVNVRRITLYAWDNSGAAQICLWLYRARPTTGGEDAQGGTCTVNNAANPQAPYTTAITFRRVNTASQSAYLWVRITGPGVKVYGIKITYAY